MDGALDLTACPNLKYLTLVNDYFSTVLFNSRTKLIELYINTTPITNIDLSTAVALNTTTKIYINSDYKLKGLRVPSNILNILINHRTINKYGTSFSYSGQGITITID